VGMQEQRLKLESLDALRFFAAAMIVLFHLVKMAKLQIPSYLHFIPNNFGLGVPLFYLVSAFGLTLGYFGKISSQSELKHYFVRRFFRIAPLFYFMMVFYIVFLYAVYGKIVSPPRS
jgi:peptidoglycan/LPS O-acetylase OafA/YrhL